MSHTIGLTRPTALAVARVLTGGLLLPAAAATASTNSLSGDPTTSSEQAPAGGEGVDVNHNAEKLGEDLRFLFKNASSIDARGDVEVDYQKIEDRFGAVNAPNMVFFIYAGYDKTYKDAVSALPESIRDGVADADSSSTVQPMNAYTDCVMEKSGFASLVSVFNGTLAGYLADGSWTKAGKLILKAAIRNGMKVTVPGIVATLGASAVWCGFTS